MSKDYRLENIARDYEIVLFDSSALIDPFNHRQRGRPNEFICYRSTINLQKKIDYILFLQECLRKKYPFYITKDVMGEINKGGGDAKTYKMYMKNSGYLRKRRVFVSPKTIKRENCEFNRLISLFVNNDRVIDEQLTDSEIEQYSNLFSDFSYLMELNDLTETIIGPNRILSETDFDFLLKGIVLSNSRGKTALLTNDSGIRKARFHLIKKQIFNPFNLVLFKGADLEYFVESEKYWAEIKKFRERRFLTSSGFVSK
jgi:hypothetical protein